MSKPQDLRISLEAETKGQPLCLDLWKGFSAPIKFTVVTVDEDAEPDDRHWYAFPHQVSDYHYDDVQIHFARALSHCFLVIKDTEGIVLEFDHTADNDTWIPDGQSSSYPDLYNDELREFFISNETANLLRLFRQNLTPGQQYSLALATDFLPMSFGTSEGNKMIPAELPLQVQCDQSSFSFEVVQGIEVPRFDVSMSSNSSICSTAGNDAFEIRLKITSHAKAPVMLGAVGGKWYHDTNLAAGWSCNAFRSLWRVFPKESLIDGYNETFDYDVWHHRQLPQGGRPSMDLVPGNYRRRIENLSAKTVPVKGLPPPSPPKSLGDEEESWTRMGDVIKSLEAVIMCPEDKIILRYRVPRLQWNALIPGNRYRLKLKSIFCKFWRTVTDTEVQGSPIRVPSPAVWPNNGPIHFETVSEVASTLESIFEREQPRPFGRLPLELRQEIFDYLRYKERARYTDFVAT